MADLGRQLHEYLAQSKAAAAAAPPAAAPAPQPAGGSQTEAAGSGGPWGWLGALGPLPWAGEADPCLAGLSRRQRLLGGGLCLALAALCLALAALCLPLLLLRARRFALLWALGSLCALGAAALLRGPVRLLRAAGRGLPLYLAALLGTLYAALGLRSAALAALGAALQLGMAAAAAIALLPGGTAGLRLSAGLLRAAAGGGGKVLPL